MIRPAVIACLLASPAIAGERVTIHHDAGPNDAWFARVHVVNDKVTLDDTFTLETSHGPVVVEYVTRANAPCPPWTWKCADKVTVISLPDGVVAVPIGADLLEDTTLEIFLYEYRGG